MKNIISFFRDKHHILFKILLFVLSTGLIVFIFPREGKFKYEFSKGKPWPHEDLIAPFDYPIYKSEDQLSKERQTVIKQTSIYFFKNATVKGESIQSFEADFEASWSGFVAERSGINLGLGRIKARLLEQGKQILERVFDVGVIELHNSIENKPRTFEVSILINNVQFYIQIYLI